MNATEIDWAGIAAWGAGIGTVLGSIGGAILFGVRSAAKVAAAAPPKVTQESTRIITTDSMALEAIAGAVEGLNITMGELRAAIDQLRAAAGALESLGQRYVRDREEERTEQAMEEEIERRTQQRVGDLLRAKRATAKRAPRRKPPSPN